MSTYANIYSRNCLHAFSADNHLGYEEVPLDELGMTLVDYQYHTK